MCREKLAVGQRARAARRAGHMSVTAVSRPVDCCCYLPQHGSPLADGRCRASRGAQGDWVAYVTPTGDSAHKRLSYDVRVLAFFPSPFYKLIEVIFQLGRMAGIWD